MSLRSLALATGALLTVWTGSASAGPQDTFRLGMTGDADVMTLAGRGDADTILVGRGGGRGGFGGGRVGFGGGRGGFGGGRVGFGGGRGGWGGWRGGWGRGVGFGRGGWRGGWGGWRGGWWGGRRFGWGGWGGWYSPWWNYGWGNPWVGYGLSYYPPAYNYCSPTYVDPSYYGTSLNGSTWTQPDSGVAPSGNSVPRQPDLLPPPTRSPGSGTFQYDGGPPQPVPLPQGRTLNPQPRSPNGGTYDYDGGPARPIPMPQGQRPTFAPQAPTPDGKVVSLPVAAKRLTYLAYGEQSRSSGSTDAPVIRVAQKSSR
jgi:hypothetical protein